MQILELFSGGQSVARCARDIGHTVLTLDISSKNKPDLCMSVLGFIPGITIPAFVPDFIWASPPCESYSVARSNAIVDKDEAMKAADKLVDHTLKIIKFYRCHFCIENPASSRLWKRDVARELLDSSCITSYCSFGMLYRKDTRIASSFGLTLPRCLGEGNCQAMIGSRHKEWAQRGVNKKKTGAVEQRNHSLDELHSIPCGLIQEILIQIPRDDRCDANVMACDGM